MKICKHCNEIKAFELFSLNNRYSDGYESCCKKCRAKKQKKYDKKTIKILVKKEPKRKTNIDFVRNLKSTTPCKDCNKFFHWSQMDFDHLHSKERKIAFAVISWEFEKVKTEIEKCDIVCANCHRLRTYNRIKTKRGE